jgi:hypothetical protein
MGFFKQWAALMVICVFGGAVLLWLIVRHSKIFKLNINIELDVLLPHTNVNGYTKNPVRFQLRWRGAKKIPLAGGTPLSCVQQCFACSLADRLIPLRDSIWVCSSSVTLVLMDFGASRGLTAFLTLIQRQASGAL